MFKKGAQAVSFPSPPGLDSMPLAFSLHLQLVKAHPGWQRPGTLDSHGMKLWNVLRATTTIAAVLPSYE